MSPTDSIRLAGLIASHARALVGCSPRLSAHAVRDYWVASKERIDEWDRHLRAIERPKPLAASRLGPRLLASASVAPMLQEVFSAEMVTRVWTAVVVAYEHSRGAEGNELLVRHILSRHAGIRQRASHLLLAAAGRGLADRRQPPAAMLRRVDHGRRRIERWTDVLIAYLMAVADVAEFAFDAARAADFAGDLSRQQQAGAGRRVWLLALSSMQAAFRELKLPGPPSSILTERIAASILACFPPELLECVGPLRSLWMTRLVYAGQDAAELIEQMLLLDGEGSGRQTAGPPDR